MTVRVAEAPTLRGGGLFDHFTGFQQYFRRNSHSDFLGCFEIDDKLKLRGLDR
jgi:hypothetical protein